MFFYLYVRAHGLLLVLFPTPHESSSNKQHKAERESLLVVRPEQCLVRLLELEGSQLVAALLKARDDGSDEPVARLNMRREIAAAAGQEQDSSSSNSSRRPGAMRQHARVDETEQRRGEGGRGGEREGEIFSVGRHQIS